MAKIILISCVSSKVAHKAKAKELYISPLFKYSLRYASALRPDKMFILSAKYGLISLEKELNPYNETLNAMSGNQRKVWAERVMNDLKKEVDLDNDEIIFLAGNNYRKHLIPYIKKYTIPLQGLGIGKQLQFLKNKVYNDNNM